MPTTLQEIVTDPKWVGNGQFDKAVAELNEKGTNLGILLRYMTAWQLALARMKYGAESDFSTQGLWVPNDHIYGVGKDADFLIVDERHSIIFENPEEVTNTHRAGREIDASKAYDRLRQLGSPNATDALKTGVLLVTRSSYRQELPTDAFGQLDVPVFVFGEKTATDYGTWLKEERGISDVTHLVVDAGYVAKERKHFVRALWVRSLDGRSELDGYYDDLHDTDGRVRGVRVVPAERAAPEVPQEVKGIDATVAQAVKEGVGFNYNGVMYVPVNRQAIEKAR